MRQSLDVRQSLAACWGVSTALSGEAARAFQHELDHLDGILIIDHAALDELPSELAKLEAPFHQERQHRAFARSVYDGNRPLYVGALEN